MSQIYSPNTVIDNAVTVASGFIDATGSAVSVTNFPATQPVSIAGTVNVITAVASSATLTITAAPASTDTVVLPSNVNRKSAILFVPKSGTSVKYGASASATSFTLLTGAANTTVIVTGYTGQLNVYGPAQSINATELV